MKYNDNGTIKEITVKAVNTNIKNEKNTSTTDTYCCNYINKFDDIGKVVNFFGDVMGDNQNMGVSCQSTCTAKKISADGKIFVFSKVLADER